MLFKTIYIISWFGNTEPLRTNRKKKHREQIENLLAFNLFNIIILAQEYEKEDFVSHPNIKYILSREVHKPNNARNILKKHFYNSEEDFALFLDDDILLTDKFVKVISEYDNQLRKAITEQSIGLISVQYGNKSYNYKNDNSLKYISKNKKLREEHENPVLYLIERPTPEALYIMKNFKKADGLEFYYDSETIYSMGKDLICNLTINGYRCYYFWNLNNDFEANNSELKSTIAKERNKNSEEFMKARKRFFDKWGDELNIPMKEIYHYEDIKSAMLNLQEKYIDLKSQGYKLVLTNDKNIYILLDEMV